MGSEQSKSPAYRTGLSTRQVRSQGSPSGIIGILFNRLRKHSEERAPHWLIQKDWHLELLIRCITNAPASSKFHD
jgi:hypothetical protein